jgi:uncharacterized alkaline shock family protein YloU
MSTVTDDRGGLTVSERAVRRIASQVTSEVGGAYAVKGGFLGIGGQPDAHERPHVEVELAESFMDLRISVGIAYPTSIRTATQRIRDEVKRRVAEMTGIEVHRVEIDVVFLHHRGSGSASRDGSRVLR